MLWTFSAERIALFASASTWVCSFVEMVNACSVFVSEAPNFDVADAHVSYLQDKGTIILMRAFEAATHEDGRSCADTYWQAYALCQVCVRIEYVLALATPIV